jgi:hypothetical protein
MCLLAFALSRGQEASAFAQNQVSGINQVASQQANAVSGVYTGTIAINQPLALGVLDVSLVITDTDGTLSGVLDNRGSLAFPSATALQGRITGSINGITTTFRIDAVPFSDLVSGRQVTRSFRMDGTVEDEGNVIRGVYTETIRGFTPQALAVTGLFLASRAAPVHPAAVTPVVTPTPATPTPTATATATVGPSSARKVFLPLVLKNKAAVGAAAVAPTARGTPAPVLAAASSEPSAR